MTAEDDRYAEQAAYNRARYAERNPEKFSPWEEQKADGWKLIEAVYALTLPEWRNNVRNLLADIDVHLTPERWGAQRHLLWQHIHWRLQQGQLVAHGRVDGAELGPVQAIERDVLDEATPDLEANTLTCGSTVFRSIRLFEAEAQSAVRVAKPASVGKDRGGRPSEFDWTAFRRELVRAVWDGGLPDRRAIRAHMRAWCTVNWEQQPDDKTVREQLNPLLDPSIPERRGN